MSIDLLLHLQHEHAFDPFPVRENLAVYHVPFADLVQGTRPETALLEACLRAERVALVGPSGSGKSSITASVLGPLTEGVAPIVVPLARETSTVVVEPRAMFAHLASTIASYALEAETLDEQERDTVLTRLTEQRPTGRRPGRVGKLSFTWMFGGLGAELAKQALGAPHRRLLRAGPSRTRSAAMFDCRRGPCPLPRSMPATSMTPTIGRRSYGP